MIEKKVIINDVQSVEECPMPSACVKEPDWELECSNLSNDLSDARTKISDLERDKGVFVSELSKIVITNQCLEDNLKWLSRRCGEYTNALFNIKEIIERASDLNESDKEKILSIINRF